MTSLDTKAKFSEENLFLNYAKNCSVASYFNHSNFHLFTYHLTDISLIETDNSLYLIFSSEISNNLKEIKLILENFGKVKQIIISPSMKEIKVFFMCPSSSNYAYNCIKNEQNLLTLVDNDPEHEDKITDDTSDEERKMNDSLFQNRIKEIISTQRYKEYKPINQRLQEIYSKKCYFQTNSFRDYNIKYVVQYIIQIENDNDFNVTNKLIGNNGIVLRKLIIDNCIRYNDYSTKIRLRGKGSGYKEGINQEESKDPLELCLSTLNYNSYLRCCFHIENILRFIYHQFYIFEVLRKGRGDNIRMKQIIKYQYVVNRQTV